LEIFINEGFFGVLYRSCPLKFNKMVSKFTLTDLKNHDYFRWEDVGFSSALNVARRTSYVGLTPTGHSNTWKGRLRGGNVDPNNNLFFMKELFPPRVLEMQQDQLYSTHRDPARLLTGQVTNLKRVHQIAPGHSPKLYGFTVPGNVSDRYAFATEWQDEESDREKLIGVRGKKQKKFSILNEAAKLIGQFDGILEKNRAQFNGVKLVNNGIDIAEPLDHLKQVLKFEYQEDDTWVNGPGFLDKVRREYSIQEGLEAELARVIEFEPYLFTDGNFKRHRDIRTHHIKEQIILDYEELGDDARFMDLAGYLSAEGRIALPDFSDLPELVATFIFYEQAVLDNYSTEEIKTVDIEQTGEFIGNEQTYQGTVEVLGCLIRQELHLDAHNKRHSRERRMKLKEGINGWSEQDMLSARMENITNIITFLGDSEIYRKTTNPVETRKLFGGWGHLLNRLELTDIDEAIIRKLRR
jgi:hypothetical protein